MFEMDGSEPEQDLDSRKRNAASVQVPGIRVLRKDTTSLILAVVIAFCGFGMLLLLAIPLLAALQSVLGVNLPGANAAVQWLNSGSKGLIQAIVLSGIGFFSYIALRHRVRNNALLYSDGGCPQCQEDELVRVRRHRSDRILTYLGIPVRRYVCRNCSWDGLRIAGRLPNDERNQEAIPADLLLANDLGIQQSETPVSENG